MIQKEKHELYERRGARNTALGLTLVGLVGLIFAVTIVKLSDGGMIEGFDHQPRSSITVSE